MGGLRGRRRPRACPTIRVKWIIVSDEVSAMIETKDSTSRRAFLGEAGRIAGVSTLAGMTLPHVHAAENNTIQLALVGCGGRGTGAIENALGIKNGPIKNGPIKLVAMADV